MRRDLRESAAGRALLLAAVAMLCALIGETRAVSAQNAPQPAPAAGRGPQAPPIVSPEVSPERRVTFRVFAPQAQSIRLAASDIPGVGRRGVWPDEDVRYRDIIGTE
jgi:hypothetical protein